MTGFGMQAHDSTSMSERGVRICSFVVKNNFLRFAMNIPQATESSTEVFATCAAGAVALRLYHLQTVTAQYARVEAFAAEARPRQKELLPIRATER